MNVFNKCAEVVSYLNSDREVDARNELIKLLDYHQRNTIEYTPLINHLIRETGLYPYMQTDTARWEDRYLYETFKVDIGGDSPVTLHREQSSLLKRLIDGESLAISAPTSFGKSFVIDAFISIKKPKNVVIIVPTIALTDETRRRLYRKFASKYKIITTTEVELGERNLLIFPQERSIYYANKLDEIDLLVVDEFYKASSKFEKERSPSLLRAMLKLGEKAKQKYFLAPNIHELKENLFTENMSFMYLDFNTVYLDKYELHEEVGGDENKKGEVLVNILKRNLKSKTLVYAGSYSNIDKVSSLVLDKFRPVPRELVNKFSDWLVNNYSGTWSLPNLAKRGFGIHNGRLHRSLSQIQIKLFEENDGLSTMISTSSIIEGVNTSAENIILWRNRSGNKLINDFTYKNIIGRGGRMFRHFIGKIYILEKPPVEADTQLELDLPDELLGDLQEEQVKNHLTKEQIAKIIMYREEMSEILGDEVFNRLQLENLFQSSDSSLVRKIALEISDDPSSWRSLRNLNSHHVDLWTNILYKIIKLQPGGWDAKWSQLVEFIKLLSQNWKKSIPELVTMLDIHDIGVDEFFKLERNATYKLAAILSDINLIQKELMPEEKIDIKPFIFHISHAFLPPAVYQLEEYGLPRMISKKIHRSGIIDFNERGLSLHLAIEILQECGLEYLTSSIDDLEEFDIYILKYFYEGISRSE